MLVYQLGRSFIEQARALPTAAGTFVGWLLSNRSSQDIYDWANYMGVINVVPPSEMHCTIMYAPDQRLDQDLHGDWPLPMPLELGRYNCPSTRILGKPGACGALVTAFDSDRLAERHRYYRDVVGLQHSFPGFLPHVTLSYDAASQPADVIRQLTRFPCGLPFCFDRERVVPANPPD